MKKLLLVTLSAVLFLSVFFGGSVSSATAKGPKVLKFNSMVGVPAGLTGAQSQGPLRGINRTIIFVTNANGSWFAATDSKRIIVDKRERVDIHSLFFRVI